MIAGEMTVSMANHGVFPEFLKQQSARGAPAAALILTGILASIMIAMNYSRSLAQGFTFLSVMVTAANMPLYLIAALGLLKLWYLRRLDGLSPSSVILPLGAVLASLYCLWVFYGVGAESMMWVLVLGAFSLPIFFFMQYWHKRQRSA
jgi:APA family basic amino acid/polyamine antiporter